MVLIYYLWLTKHWTIMKAFVRSGEMKILGKILKMHNHDVNGKISTVNLYKSSVFLCQNKTSFFLKLLL